MARLFKTAAHFTALAGHGFQQNGSGLAGEEDRVEGVGDERDARLRALSHMAAGMKVVELAGQRFHAPQVVGKGQTGEFPHLRLVRAGVDRVGRVGQERAEVMPGGEGHQRRGVVGVKRFGLTASWIAGKKLKGVGAQRKGGPAHGQKPIGSRQMTADGKHKTYLLYIRYTAQPHLGPLRVMTP